MVTHPERALNRLITQLEDGERGRDDTDRELLLAFSRRLRLLSSEYSDQRHEKLLRHCVIVSEQGGSLAAALKDKSVAEEIVSWIHREYENEETNKDYRIALRMFGKRVTETDAVDVATDRDGVPEPLAWIPSTTSRSYDPTPDPGNMLDWELDIQPMIDACLNARDKALIAAAWDAGPRAEELLNLRVGDVTDHRHGLQITVDGKTGQRSITLVTASPRLSRWLEDHPRRDDATAPLWCNLQSGEELSYQMCRKIPREAASRADVHKPVTFTNFRKSSASHLASQGVSQSVLEEHHGWSRGSDAAARYIAVFGDASDRQIAKAHGLDVEDEEPDRIAAVQCPRCDRKTPPDESFCMWCHQALSTGAVKEIEEKQASQRRQLLALAKEHPELLDRLEEMEPLVEALDGNPTVVETARRFADALDDG